MPVTYTPLRYPGGKSVLSGYLREVIVLNGLKDPVYAEPFCGGAGAALILLLSEYVSEVHLNDIDPAVYSFWRSCVHYADALCERVRKVRLSVAEWDRQREVITRPRHQKVLDLGFATLFMNRVNRSGILRGGIIGGRKQRGNWGMDARFNREDLINKIQQLARYKSRIHVSRLDAMQFIRERCRNFPANSLSYIDPPYVGQGSSLYENHYTERDHRSIARALASSRFPWVVSYDNCRLIRELYGDHTHHTYSLRYSANEHREGNEIVVLSSGLRGPVCASPLMVPRQKITIARPVVS